MATRFVVGVWAFLYSALGKRLSFCYRVSLKNTLEFFLKVLGMNSMTGYGRIQTRIHSHFYEMSLRSVNGRFLETRIHIPKEFYFLEAKFKNLLAEYFKRGCVDFYMSERGHEDVAFGQQRVVVNTELAKALQAAHKELARALKVKASLDLNELMRHPDVVQVVQEELSFDEKSTEILASFRSVCESLKADRLREGLALQKIILTEIESLDKMILEFRSWEEKAKQHLKERFLKRWQEKKSEMNVDESRLLQEVAFLIDKSDIHEEISRLAVHTKEVKKLVASEHSEPLGKKLDFYCQELLRELNTMGSKTQLPALTQAVVEAKSLVEKIKEQVQNIE